ncbi:MAG TPA: nucleotidyltransferase domain-containing protein [Gemmatimonadales bacterium]|jgi:predicted nucleotidyltransferase|nr:nucleotidyltransferase domain-containing protein [Gemmatimonadales bacterium]
MRATVARVVDPFLNEADRVLGAAYSAVLYGSAARGDFVPGRSDINLLLVVDELAPPTLRSLGRGFTGWRKSMTEPPLILSRLEWSRASDAFPIEITDMRLSYRVLRGSDPLEGIQPVLADLRKALEREFRGKLLRLRQGYATYAPDPAVLGTLGLQSAATILVLLRGVLTVVGRPVPGDSVELSKSAAETVGFEAEHVLHVVRHRSDREWRCAAPEFENYMNAVEQTARFVDQLQLGAQE